LTIGYGDFIPNSDASKPFYVVWSLLSVPILTIFINNSIDAVYGIWPSFVRSMQHCRHHWMRVPQLHQTARDSQGLHSCHYDIPGSEGVNSEEMNVELRFRGENDFLKSMFPEHDASSRSHKSAAVAISEFDLSAHCCLLARELGIIAKNLVTEPGKKYSYQQWAYYINLTRRTTSYQRFNEEAQRIEEPRSAHIGVAGPSSAVYTLPSSIQWASCGTPILLPNESEWLLQWLLSELTRSLHALLPHDNEEHLSL
jgi:potassium channel subfamily K